MLNYELRKTKKTTTVKPRQKSTSHGCCTCALEGRKSFLESFAAQFAMESVLRRITIVCKKCDEFGVIETIIL